MRSHRSFSRISRMASCSVGASWYTRDSVLAATLRTYGDMSVAAYEENTSRESAVSGGEKKFLPCFSFKFSSFFPYLFDGDEHDGDDDRDADAGDGAECPCADQLVWVLERLLLAADGEQRHVGVFLGIAHEIHVRQLPDLRPGAGGKKEEMNEHRKEGKKEEESGDGPPGLCAGQA